MLGWAGVFLSKMWGRSSSKHHTGVTLPQKDRVSATRFAHLTGFTAQAFSGARGGHSLDTVPDEDGGVTTTITEEAHATSCTISPCHCAVRIPCRMRRIR